MDLPQIHKYVTRDYKDIAESVAYHSLKYLKSALDLNNVFYKGYSDGLKAGEEIYYVGIKNGQPFVENVNPLFFSYENSLGLQYIHEAGWCCYEMDVTLTELHDRLYDKLTEKQLSAIMEKIDYNGQSQSHPLGTSATDYNHIVTKVSNTNENPLNTSNIKLYHVAW